MKNSKFWIWFIPLFLIACVGVYFLVDRASKYPTNKTQVDEQIDAAAIKEAYERLNNDESIKVELPEDNSYVIANKKMIEEVFKNNGIIYFGNVYSKASRKNVSLLNSAVASTSINKIYFINIANIEEDFTNYLKEHLSINDMKAGDTYLVKENEVISTIISTKYDNDKELSDKDKENIQKEYLEKIIDLAEKCDESC